MTAVEPTTEPTADPTESRSRRDVLCGLMVALLAPGALVACGDSNSSSGGTPAGGGSTGGASGGGAKLASLSQVPQGSGLIVDKPGGGKILLVRPSGDEVKAFNAACKHQGTIVGVPKSGVITCPSHGSQYDGATGALKKGPATSGLDAVPVKVDGGNVVLA